MTDTSTSPAEQIEFLATRIMGWHAFDLGSKKGEWSPITSWDDWRQVEEKVMEDIAEYGGLWGTFTRNIYRAMHNHEDRFDFGWVDLYALAELPTRVSCLISAHKELYGN